MDDENIRAVNCLICDASTNRMHFRVAACRACAVFYRRSINLQKEYVCQLGTKNCDLTKGGQTCRYCRFEKCKKIGMRFERSHSESSKHVKIHKNSSIELPEIQPDPSIPSNNPQPQEQQNGEVDKPKQILVNDKEVLDRVREILSNRTPQTISQHHPSFMHQINEGFSKFVSNLLPTDEVFVSPQFDQKLLFEYQGKYMIEFAWLLTNSTMFSRLPLEDKLKLYNQAWFFFYSLERCYASMLYFGEDLEDNRIFYGEHAAIDLGEHTREKNPSSIWQHLVDRHINYQYKPMKIMKITQFEMVYIFSLILWNIVDITDLLPETYSIARQILEEMSIDLHNYYVHEMGLSFYAPRIAKLYSLKDTAKWVFNSKKEAYLMGKIFNLFEYEWVCGNLVNPD